MGAKTFYVMKKGGDGFFDQKKEALFFSSNKRGRNFILGKNRRLLFFLIKLSFSPFFRRFSFESETFFKEKKGGENFLG